MAKVKGNKAVLNNTEEKIVTKYDKKGSEKTGAGEKRCKS